jgi:hypothetical protein
VLQCREMGVPVRVHAHFLTAILNFAEGLDVISFQAS